MNDSSQPPLLRMEKINKRFGRVTALTDVNLTLNAGEVLGLLGDNGAGKSTLIKILVGLLKPDSGKIFFKGEEVSFKSPWDSRAHGIETVYQDMGLVNPMSVTRNFFLGKELTYKIGPFKILDLKKMREISAEFLNDIGVHIGSGDEPVSSLSGGERQSIAIARAIHFEASLLALDEPTAALSIKESTKVLEYVLEAKARGIAVIFITHNIYHVHSVADRFTVLDRGAKVSDYNKNDVTPEFIMKVIAKD